MKKSLLIQSSLALSLGLGLAVAAMAQAPPAVLDTPEVKAELAKARALAANDEYLRVTQLLQCRDLDVNGVPTGPPGGNERTGRSVATEVAAVPTKVFDNVYYVGSTTVGGWVIDTGDGYILLDSMWPHSLNNTLLPGMRKLGLDPAKVKLVLVTHGSGPTGDHTGGAKHFVDNYNSQVVLSAQEWSTAANRTYATGEEWIRPSNVIAGTDGRTVTVGDTTVTMVHTPRTVGGGGLSYFIPVKLNGQTHMWATYGNTNVVGGLEDKLLYRKAVARFLTYVDRLKPDIVISSHPFVDGSIPRMEQMRNSPPGAPNPFLIGQQNARRYIEILDQCAAVHIARARAGLDETGTKRAEAAAPAAGGRAGARAPG